MKKVVIITGAASGIGSACAKIFSENGYTVIGFDRQDPKEGNFITEFFNVELAKPAEIQQAFSQFTGRHGQLDVLINNAGAHLYKSVDDTSVTDFQNIMNINVTAPFLLSKLSYPMLKKTKGAIVNVSSVHALATTPRMTAYATSKGALISMSRVLALEYAPDVRVNTVIPGVIDTPMMRGHGEKILAAAKDDNKTVDDYVQDLAHGIPAKRAGEPKEIAETIYFLASSNSSYITAQTLTVDGGMIAQLPGHR